MFSLHCEKVSHSQVNQHIVISQSPFKSFLMNIAWSNYIPVDTSSLFEIYERLFFGQCYELKI